MTVWKRRTNKNLCVIPSTIIGVQTKMANKNDFVPTVNVNFENKYSEFTTLFRVPFNDVDPTSICTGNTNRWKHILAAWSVVCIRALEARMNSCISMLFRNRDNIKVSNEYQIIFKKSNGQYHSFNHPSFRAMEEMKEYLENKNWNSYVPSASWVRQLLKALYWIPEEDKQERNNYGFGQLISCLEEFTLFEG